MRNQHARTMSCITLLLLVASCSDHAAQDDLDDPPAAEPLPQETKSDPAQATPARKTHNLKLHVTKQGDPARISSFWTWVSNARQRETYSENREGQTVDTLAGDDVYVCAYGCELGLLRITDKHIATGEAAIELQPCTRFATVLFTGDGEFPTDADVTVGMGTRGPWNPMEGRRTGYPPGSLHHQFRDHKREQRIALPKHVARAVLYTTSDTALFVPVATALKHGETYEVNWTGLRDVTIRTATKPRRVLVHADRLGDEVRDPNLMDSIANYVFNATWYRVALDTEGAALSGLPPVTCHAFAQVGGSWQYGRLAPGEETVNLQPVLQVPIDTQLRQALDWIEGEHVVAAPGTLNLETMAWARENARTLVRAYEIPSASTTLPFAGSATVWSKRRGLAVVTRSTDGWHVKRAPGSVKIICPSLKGKVMLSIEPLWRGRGAVVQGGGESLLIFEITTGETLELPGLPLGLYRLSVVPQIVDGGVTRLNGTPRTSFELTAQAPDAEVKLLGSR